MKVLYFSGSWCAPYKAFLPVVEATCNERDIEMQIVDVEVNSEFANLCNVKSVPTLIVVNDTGVELFRTAGVMPATALRQTLEGLRQ